jgi:hypothetical protein
MCKMLSLSWGERKFMSAIFGLFTIVNTLIFLGFMALTVYLYIMLFKIITRGIRALDLYIMEKERR